MWLMQSLTDHLCRGKAKLCIKLSQDADTRITQPRRAVLRKQRSGDLVNQPRNVIVLLQRQAFMSGKEKSQVALPACPG